jgi:ABC-type transporter Mla maintaining outer membrane lipid asymmetry ATPase subunit MlaF
MTPKATIVLEVRDLVKNYQALRPLRLKRLVLHAGERVALSGFDAGAAEILVNTLNGALLPDAGEVVLFGRRTADITDSDEWLRSLDRFGIVTRRAVLLGGATVEQNLALPFTLEIDRLSEAIGGKVAMLAAEAGLSRDWLGRPAAQAPADVQMRAHLARALAMDPGLLVCEHPTVGLARETVQAFAATVRDVAAARGLAVLVLTEDSEFADAVARKAFKLKPGTGELANSRGWLAALGWR